MAIMTSPLIISGLPFLYVFIENVFPCLEDREWEKLPNQRCLTRIYRNSYRTDR